MVVVLTFVLDLFQRSHSSSSIRSSHEEHAHSDVIPPIMTTSNVHTIPPAQVHAHAKKLKKGDEGGVHMGYIATLQSTRAWDALIHGSMS